MPATPDPAPTRGVEDTCLTRPLILVAALVIAGHQFRGSLPAPPSHSTPHPEEVLHHG